MTEHLAIVTNQVIIFGILMSMGFIAAKTKVLTKEALIVLARLIVNIILPALIFTVVAGSGLTLKDFVISGRFAFGVVLCFTLLTVAGFILSKLGRLEGKTANVFIALSTFSNIGFMGIPLIQAIYTEPIAQVCISVYTLFDMALLWTYGVFLCRRHEANGNPLSAMRSMINPTTVALLVAFVVMALALPVPKLLMSTIAGVGGTSKYLALIYIGGSLAYVSLKNIWKKPSIFILVAAKMIIMPVSIYYILGLFLEPIPRTILSLIVGLPPMAAIVMLAATYQSDYEYATETIFVLTLASLVTIPVVSAINSMM